MSEKYLPSTPPRRACGGTLRRGDHAASGVQPGPVYVYTAGIRIWHW